MQPRTTPAPVDSSAGWTDEVALAAEELSYRYGNRRALDRFSLEVRAGEMVGVLGPNGSGKTTLFHVLSTLRRPSEGRVRIFGVPAWGSLGEVRRMLGVVFQNPGLDPKLTVLENLLHHGLLYGMRGETLHGRARELLSHLGVETRAGDRVETLSGGLRRRVELAKALLHGPRLLVLDEPSTGLDPGARRDFGQYLRSLSNEKGTAVVLTTHDMEEAERCDRVVILHEGRTVGSGKPSELKAQLGGDVVVVRAVSPESLAEKIARRFGIRPRLVDGTLRLERARGHELARDLVESFPDEILSVTYGKPTLEDVFVRLTGHRFWQERTPSREVTE
ncbi:MAG: ABC transporter [Candidatus Binatia bacterium]|nr:MAG: ABC transporter [Candidatus Binatia bacterium]